MMRIAHRFIAHSLCRPTAFGTAIVSCAAQIVAAFDAVAAPAADHTACGERAERQQPENRSVEDRVDREAGPDGMQWQESDLPKDGSWL